MTYGYIRVSTDHQTTENQRFEINQFCDKHDIDVSCWIEETISATKALEKRKLGRRLKRGAKITSIAKKLDADEDTVSNFMVENNMKRRYRQSKFACVNTENKD